MSEQTNTGVPEAPKEETIREARRRFLNECGRFAIATPPAVALLLAASERKFAVAHSGNPNS